MQIDRVKGAALLAEVTILGSAYQSGTTLTVCEEPFWKEIERFYEEAPALALATLNWLEGR